MELYGERGFDYAGNATVDLAVWRHARRALVVNAAPALIARASAVCEVERIFARPVSPWRQWLRALRLYQWLKNVLIFMPLAAGHALNQPGQAVAGHPGFPSASACAPPAPICSMTYWI